MTADLRPAPRGGSAIKVGLGLAALALVALIVGMPPVLGVLMLAVAALLLVIGIGPRLARSGLGAAGRAVDSWWARHLDRRAERRLHGLRKLAADEDREHPEHGAGPWLLDVQSLSGRIVDQFGNNGRGSSRGTVAVYDADDLDRRLARAKSEPDLVVQVRPMPDDSGGNPPPGGNPATEGNTMATPRVTHGAASRIAPDRRAQRAAGQAAQAMPAAWAQVVAQVADADAGSDAELLDFMDEQVMGVAAYAEALVDFYEAHVSGKGLDPRSLQAVHDVADAVAHAAEMMAGARSKFGEHYELPREYAGNGGVMPHDGRFFSGE